MDTFADRLVERIKECANPCVVGLDPRIELMPDFVKRDDNVEATEPAGIRETISEFHRVIIDVVASLVPAVKLQIAFYEQYGLPGMEAFQDTIKEAKRRGLLVIVDAKRNDIASTAEAYAHAYLARPDDSQIPFSAFDVDAITVSPYLGRDSLLPFVRACQQYGKGIFILVKTSNPGSSDIQDQVRADGTRISDTIARFVDDLGRATVGRCGYSSVGAVVGATFPEEAARLRLLMPKALILVPGYGAQGGTADEAVANFNRDGLGAIVNASRSITYAFNSVAIQERAFRQSVEMATKKMITEVTASLETRR